LEDDEMSENINTNETEATACEKYTLAYAMDMIERIALDKEHILMSLQTIIALENEGTPCGGSADKSAEAAMQIVKCRETTNQKLIEFYANVVEDLKPRQTAQEAELRREFLDFVKEVTATADHRSGLPDFEGIWKTVYLNK
jgi:hypothetical protein